MRGVLEIQSKGGEGACPRSHDRGEAEPVFSLRSSDSGEGADHRMPDGCRGTEPAPGTSRQSPKQISE